MFFVVIILVFVLVIVVLIVLVLILIDFLDKVKCVCENVMGLFVSSCKVCYIVCEWCCISGDV